MPSRLIVERFDVVRNVCSGNFSVFVDPLLDSLLLQTAKEGFCDRVVPAVSPPAHAWFETVRLAEASPTATSVLRASVRVNESPYGTAAAHRHHDRIEGKFPGDRWSGRPSDYL